MFCPNCGQQQVADYIKFCSRCGLAISGLGEFIAGGAVVTTRRDTTAVALPAIKRKAVRRGAKMMFLSGVLSPLFFGMCFLADSPGPLLIPLSMFLAGLAMLLYAQLFGEENPSPPSQPYEPPSFGVPPDSAALPSAANLSLNRAGGRKAGTAEMVAPLSVTEHTTKLLDGNEN